MKNLITRILTWFFVATVMVGGTAPSYSRPQLAVPGVLSPIGGPAGLSIGKLSTGVVTAYLGEVATGAYYPTAKSSNSAQQLYSRKTVFATDDISALQVEFDNSWIGAQNAPSNGTETGPGGPMGITAAVEFPAGTIIGQFKFSGAVQGSVADGGKVLSDLLTTTALVPRGSKFWIRSWQSQPLGVVYSTPNVAHADDQVAYGTTTPDLTMGGTASAANSAVGYGPSAIVAMTTRPSVFLSGDSRMRGTGDTVDASGDVGEVARSLGAAGIGYINAAAGSDQLGNMVGNYAKRGAKAAYCSHAILIAGSNDILIGGATAAQVKSRNEAMITLLKAKVQTGIVDIATLAPMGSSGNTVNTTVNPVRITHNANVRSSNIAGARFFYEIADIMDTTRDSGVWKSSPQAYSTDWLHETQYAYKLIQSGGVIPASNFTYPAQ